jgi:glycosyltransferase involved in cell wall biosynthesis
MLEADVVGLFSFFEGLPNTICEGMALGKPILASAVSDIPLFIEDEINGKLFNPFDVNSIAESIRYFLSLRRDELEMMGVQNRQKAVELFDHKKNLRKYIELIK